MKERFLIWFWSLLPNSWLYWAVNQAWAKATTTLFTDRHPNEVSWEMMQRYLSAKPQRKNTGVKRSRGTNETLAT